MKDYQSHFYICEFAHQTLPIVLLSSFSTAHSSALQFICDSILFISTALSLYSYTDRCLDPTTHRLSSSLGNGSNPPQNDLLQSLHRFAVGRSDACNWAAIAGNFVRWYCLIAFSWSWGTHLSIISSACCGRSNLAGFFSLAIWWLKFWLRRKLLHSYLDIFLLNSLRVHLILSIFLVKRA